MLAPHPWTTGRTDVWSTLFCCRDRQRDLTRTTLRLMQVSIGVDVCYSALTAYCGTTILLVKLMVASSTSPTQQT